MYLDRPQELFLSYSIIVTIIEKGRASFKALPKENNKTLPTLTRVSNPFCTIHTKRFFGGRTYSVHENALLGRSAPTLILNLTPLILNSGRLSLGHIIGVKSSNHVLVLGGNQDFRSTVVLGIGVFERNSFHSVLIEGIGLPTLCYSLCPPKKEGPSRYFLRQDLGNLFDGNELLIDKYRLVGRRFTCLKNLFSDFNRYMIPDKPFDISGSVLGGK